MSLGSTAWAPLGGCCSTGTDVFFPPMCSCSSPDPSSSGFPALSLPNIPQSEVCPQESPRGEKPLLAFLDGLPPLSWAGCDPLGQSGAQ